MKKLMSVVMLSLMGLGIFGAAIQPVDAYAASKGLFDDFDVNIDENGEVVVDSEATQQGAWTTLIEKYKNFIVGFSGIAAVTMVAAFILQFMKLGTTAGNPSERSKAVSGILWTGIAAALLGAVSLITGIFYGFIN